MTPAALLRHATGVLAFLGAWVVVFLLGAAAGDFWFWLGLLFGWIPALLLSRLAETLWPVLWLVAAWLGWRYLRS